ncbi:MAG: hypothetical protein Q9216_004715 [Gyalolechia sp. 2 TL-2023]
MFAIRAVLFVLFNFCVQFIYTHPHLSQRAPDSQVASAADQVQHHLGSRLSSGARIYRAHSTAYQNANVRWSAAQNPTFAAVIVPAKDEDVVAAVQFANAKKIPFLAVNRGHGTTTDMNNLHYGLNIYLRNLNSITIAPDGKSATMGGGVYGDQVIRYLAANGKVAATGSCTCTSLLGPALGGGFNRYQGLHGLMLDNILSLTLVTANGTLLTTSPTQHPDLFWAMRGAGHNFGIVTSVEYRIFEDETPVWWAGTLVFEKESLDDVFRLLSVFNKNETGEQDSRATFFTVLAADTELVGNNPVLNNPVLIVSIYFAGSASDGLSYIQPLLALNPLRSSNQSVLYTDFADAVGTGVKSPVCSYLGNSAATFPVGLKEYDIDAIHQIYDLFVEFVSEHPDFRSSAIQFEAYPMGEVKKVEEGSTAYAHREDKLMVSLLALYTPSSPASTNDDIAHDYGTRIRQALLPSSPSLRLQDQTFNAYVNYAYGDETTEMLYGYEAWRLEKLRALKKEWDPRGVFGWYHPIR